MGILSYALRHETPTSARMDALSLKERVTLELFMVVHNQVAF